MTARATGAHHFFVAAEDVHDGIVELAGAEGHHAAHVLRLRPGEVITAADGSGRLLEAAVTNVGEGVRADVRSVRVIERPKPAVTLYQAVAKGDRMDDAVGKAVEVGVARIEPFVAERTVVRWNEAKKRKARERWTSIARSAAKQCRSAYLTDVGDVREGPAGALAEGAPVLVLHEGATTRLRDALPVSTPDAVVLVVGPEGGLAPAELESLREGGASILTLGGRILRTETAGVVATALISYAYGSLG